MKRTFVVKYVFVKQKCFCKTKIVNSCETFFGPSVPVATGLGQVLQTFALRFIVLNCKRLAYA